MSVIHGVARHPQGMKRKEPNGRGAGQASDRRGRGFPGQGRCPLEGVGGTSRSEWRLGVFHFLARSARMPAEKRCSIGVLSPGGTINSIS